MKINGKLLALCVYHPDVWGTNAFFGQAPKVLTFNGHTRKSINAQSSALHSFAYLGGEEPGSRNSERPPASGPPPTGGPLGKVADMQAKNIWDSLSPITVQGGSLRTWSFTSPSVERCQVLMKTDGRPMNAQVDLWQGPDNTPQRMGVYIEDGLERPFSAIIETPGSQNAIAIRNTAQLEFPLAACVEADVEDAEGISSAGLEDVIQRLEETSVAEIIQGGSLKTYPFAPAVSSVQVLLKTDGRPLNARIELLQGPNNNKQIIEVYAEDGMLRPFFIVIESPGTGNVCRILNTAPVEFPMTCTIEPYLVEPYNDAGGVVVSAGGGWDSPRGTRPY